MSTIFTGNSETTKPEGSEHPYNLRRALERFERGYLQNILVLVEWDKVRATKMLGIHPKTLEAKLKKHELL